MHALHDRLSISLLFTFAFVLMQSDGALGMPSATGRGPDSLAAKGLIGTWRLESFTSEVLATGEKHDDFGPHPTGYLGYGADGRMYAILAMDNRVKPRNTIPTDEEKIRLFGSVIAYAGTYTVDAEKVVHHVDVSWNERFTGTDLVRFYKLDGDTLTITTAPAKSVIDGKEGRTVLVWKRVRP